MRDTKLKLMTIMSVSVMILASCKSDEKIESQEENQNNDKVTEESNNLENNENSEENQNNSVENEEDDNIITSEMMDDPSIIALVNKQYHLTAEDAPEDLVTVD